MAKGKANAEIYPPPRSGGGADPGLEPGEAEGRKQRCLPGCSEPENRGFECTHIEPDQCVREIYRAEPRANQLGRVHSKFRFECKKQREKNCPPFDNC